jgi:LysR family transcriptional regulator, benzoate and cis,cis-muconate-responsive activator of ben and cat genes
VDLDLRQLRYFVAVAEELHFSRAAERLRIDQPTLSRHVRRLEEMLGVKLLERTTRTVSLTKGGEAFLKGAYQIIGAADAAAVAAREAASGRVGLLRVGMMVQVAEPLRSAALNLFEKRYPDVHLKPVSYPFVDPSCGLESGETDVAFVWLPLEHPQIETERLFEEPRYFILASDHRLARRRSISREEVDDEPFFTWPESWGLSPTAMGWGDFFQLDPKLDGTRRVGSIHAHDEDEWLDALVRGQAISTAPASAKTYYPWPGISYVQAEGIDPAVVAIAWRRDDSNPLVPNFLGIVREVRAAAGLR